MINTIAALPHVRLPVRDRTPFELATQRVADYVSGVREYENIKAQASRKLAEVKQEAQEQISAVAGELTPEEKTALFSAIYWQAPEVPAQLIAQAFGLSYGKLVSKILPYETPIQCLDCDDYLMARSRAHHDRIVACAAAHNTSPFNEDVRCPNCAQQAKQRTWTQYRQEREDREARKKDQIAELRALPYRVYLRTVHWQKLRDRALKQAWYRCQVCNDPYKQLEVHHNTYERRGCELPRDLVVLCSDCHTTHHVSMGHV